MRTHWVVDSPVGDLTLVAEDGLLTRLTMDDQKYVTEATELGDRDDAAFGVVVGQLEEYFAGERTTFEVPLAPAGDAFKQRVWALLSQIPYGQTRSYRDLAVALGDPNLSQAVGSANARNPIGIIIPCHRVIGSDGSLVGYAGGLDRKRFLLSLEEPAEVRDARLF
jgi:methylated-DNA-[protein]-cysteine S-methyltransferase